MARGGFPGTVLAAAALLLSGCFTAGMRPPAPAADAAAGLTAARIADIDAFIEREMAERHIAGLALAVARNGRILWTRGYGLADVEARVPARPETRFMIASITKMFTAVGVMMLVHEGSIALDQPLGELLPEAPAAWRRATVHQLLNHTAGIPSFTRYDAPPCGRARAEADYDRDDVLSEVSCLPLDFVPGSDWSYSDTGYHLLGLLIERISGMRYEAFLEQRIFEPSGMTSTRLMAMPGIADDRAVGYRWTEGFRRAPVLHPYVEMSTGGLVSNLFDLARFDAALAEGRLLPPDMLERMWRPAGIGSAVYGMGFALRPVAGRRQIGHTGGGPGATTAFARFPDDGFTIIVLANTAQPPFSVQELVGGIVERIDPGSGRAASPPRR